MTFNEQEIRGMAEIIQGYANWREHKLRNIDSGDELDVSVYLDDLAKQRAVDTVNQIQQAYFDPDLDVQQFHETVARLLGLVK